MVAELLFLVFIVFSGSESLIAFKATQSLVSMTLGNTTKFIVKAQSLIDGAMKTLLLFLLLLSSATHKISREQEGKNSQRNDLKLLRLVL